MRYDADGSQSTRHTQASIYCGGLRVFLTGRRAPAGPHAADICPVTGRARMSYRRAAEIFTSVTRPLDPAGRGWTLQQLRRAGQAAAASARG